MPHCEKCGDVILGASLAVETIGRPCPGHPPERMTRLLCASCAEVLIAWLSTRCRPALPALEPVAPAPGP